MAKGHALLVGLKSVDPASYNGWDGTGGCRDGFTSAGYQHGGAFTIALCEAWQDGAFAGTFKDLHEKICELIRSSQKLMAMSRQVTKLAEILRWE